MSVYKFVLERSGKWNRCLLRSSRRPSPEIVTPRSPFPVVIAIGGAFVRDRSATYGLFIDIIQEQM